jgi:hypothetical protein
MSRAYWLRMSHELFLMFPLYTTTFGLATYSTEITGYQDLGKLLMVGYLDIKQHLSWQKHNDYL